SFAHSWSPLDAPITVTGTNLAIRLVRPSPRAKLQGAAAMERSRLVLVLVLALVLVLVALALLVFFGFALALDDCAVTADVDALFFSGRILDAELILFWARAGDNLRLCWITAQSLLCGVYCSLRHR